MRDERLDDGFALPDRQRARGPTVARLATRQMIPSTPAEPLRAIGRLLPTPLPRSWGKGRGGKERDFPTGSVAAVVKLAGHGPAD